MSNEWDMLHIYNELHEIAEQQRYNILASRWLTNKDGFMGVVAYETDTHEEDHAKRTWKAVLGRCAGDDPIADMQYIAAWGAALSEQEAHGFFPEIIRAYKGIKP